MIALEPKGKDYFQLVSRGEGWGKRINSFTH